jgi:hypothetical protein
MAQTVAGIIPARLKPSKTLDLQQFSTFACVLDCGGLHRFARAPKRQRTGALQNLRPFGRFLSDSKPSTLNQPLIMAKRDAVPKTQDGYLKWHDTLKAGVTAATPGATAADVTMLTTDNAAIHTKMTTATNADNASKAAHNDLNTAIASSQKNARALAQRIKKSTAYTTPIGDQLGIEGPEDSVDMTQQAPTLDAEAQLAGVVAIGFNKMDAEGVHIYGMRDGEAGFTLLASETHSPYVDNRPLLTAGKPETRQYKAMFFLGKAEIGLSSAVVIATAAP